VKQKMATKGYISQFQITGCFDLSRYIRFTTYVDIVYSA